MIFCCAGTLLTEPAVSMALLAYVGPAGLGAVGVLLLVVAVLAIGALGLVLHPVRLYLRRRRRLREERDRPLEAAASPSSLNESR